ncbi:MFS transporter [Thermoplasmatales archaeon AK]|nr:MFS transporter [Thermoplasmatales archaeon AK]
MTDNGKAVVSRRQVWAALTTFLSFTVDQYSGFVLIVAAPFIAEIFFPSSNYAISLLLSFVTVATGYLIRPIGALLFGPHTDKVGRRNTMVITTTIVTLITAAIGILPTYAQAGLISPILLLVIRLLNGLFTGAMTTGTHTIGLETVKEKFRGIVGGSLSSSAGLGSLLGSIAFTAVSVAYPGNLFTEVGWRVYFLTAAVGVVVPIITVLTIKESYLFALAKVVKKTIEHPFRYFFSPKNHLLKSFFLGILMTLSWSMIVSGVVHGVLTSYLLTVNHMSRVTIGELSIYGGIAFILGPLVGGQVSQVIGRKRTAILGAVLLFFPAFSYYMLSTVGNSLYGALPYIVLLSFFGAFGAGMYVVFLDEMFPTKIRASAVSLTYNIGLTIGGTTTIWVGLLLVRFGFSAYPLIIVAFVAVLAVVIILVALFSRETKGSMLEEEKEAISEVTQ